VKQSSQVVNVLACKPGAIFPIVWVILVACFFAFVIYTSPRFHKHTTPENLNN
jgi:hypothetical protein